MDSTFDTTRRAFLVGVGGAIAAGAVASQTTLASAGASDVLSDWPIAVSDRAMGLRQHLGGFAAARDAQATGVEIDFGRLGSGRALQSRLITAAGRQQFNTAADESGTAIAALALGAFADQSFANHPQADAVFDEFLHALHAGRIRVGVLPLGRADDLSDAGVRTRVIGRLSAFADRARRDGSVVALDTALPPAELAALLDAVGSPAVQACVSDAASFVAVGAGRVAQVRFRFDASDSQRNAGELVQLRRAMSAADWSGWIVVDRPIASAGSILDDVQSSVHCVRSAFRPAFA